MSRTAVAAISVALILSMVAPSAAVAGARAGSGTTTTTTDAPGASVPAADWNGTAGAPAPAATSGGTNGSDAAATPPDADLQVINGYSPPELDGRLYGHLGESVPDGSAAEWADGAERSTTFVPAGAGPDELDGRTFLKLIPAVAVREERADETGGGTDTRTDLYLGTRVAGADWGPDGADPLRSVTVTLDMDGDGEPSSGDVRLSAPAFAREDEGAAGGERSFTYREVSLYREGDFRPAPDALFEETTVGSAVLRSSDDGTTVESRVRVGLLRERLATLEGVEYAGLDRIGYGLAFETDSTTYRETSGSGDGSFPVSVGRVLDQLEVIEAGAGFLPLSPCERDPVPCHTADLDIEDVELYQSVQTQGTGLKPVRDKATLARVLVKHGKSSPVPVEVTFRAYRTSSGSSRLIGTKTVTYNATSGSPAPDDLSQGATLELPASWTQYAAFKLEVSVSSPTYYTNGDTATARTFFVSTHDLTVYRLRLNTGTRSSPQVVGTSNVRSVSAEFTERVPVADPNFVNVGHGALGPVNTNKRNRILDRMMVLALRIRAAQTTIARRPGGVPPGPPLDQLYGFATIRGLSHPTWAGGRAFAAYGSDFDATMAHEINHNIGDRQWSMHVSNSSSEGRMGIRYGCGAAGTDQTWAGRFNDGNVHVRGWDPGDRIVPASEEDFMTYCDNRWTSDYRWRNWLSELRNFTPGQPASSSSAASDAGAPAGTAADELPARDLPPSGTEVLGREVPTVRVVRGVLHRNGSASLTPSFEQPGLLGEAPGPIGNASRADVRLRIVRGDSVDEIPIEAIYTGSEGVESDRDYFSTIVQDNGTVRRVELVDAETGDTLDTLSGTGYEVESAAVDTPRTFEREGVTEVGLDVETGGADTGGPLHKLVLYNPAPGEGGIWLPHGQRFRDSSFGAQFTGLPGGENARFLVLLSDGLETRFVASPAFEVPRRPPNVTIQRTERYEVEFADEPTPPDPPEVTEIRNVAGPIRANAGEVVSVDARVRKSLVAREPPRLRWKLLDEAGTVVATDGGSRFVGPAPGVLAPGEHELRVTATDPVTGLSDTDSIRVIVSPPPLPDAALVEAFDAGIENVTGAANATTALRLAPAETTVAPDRTARFEVVLEGLGDGTGVGAYDLTVEVADPGTATIVDASDRTGGTASVDVTADGQAADISAVGGDTADAGPVTVATVTVRGVEPGETRLSLSEEGIGDEANEPYAVGRLGTATLRVREEVRPPPVCPDGAAPTDPDGDSVYEDIDGDNSFTVFDIQCLLDNFDTRDVRDNPDAFDFNADGGVDIFDVQAALDEL